MKLCLTSNFLFDLEMRWRIFWKGKWQKYIYIYKNNIPAKQLKQASELARANSNNNNNNNG